MLKKVYLSSLISLVAGAVFAAGEVKMPIFYGHRGDREFGLENTMNAYKTAVEEKYRFFSFGDAMLIV